MKKIIETKNPINIEKPPNLGIGNKCSFLSSGISLRLYLEQKVMTLGTTLSVIKNANANKKKYIKYCLLITFKNLFNVINKLIY